MAEEVVVEIVADASPFEQTLKQLEGLSGRFGAQLSSGLKSAIAGGKELDDILRRIALNLSGAALDRALQPVENLAGSLFSNLLGGLAGGLKVTPFASGGVVAAPNYFPMSSGLGLMGEAGAEAIMPLQRTADGSLGVAGGGGQPVSIVFNVTATDAASFRKSEAQITGMLARAVARGSRGM